MNETAAPHTEAQAEAGALGHVVIVGAGALGGYVGLRLSAAGMRVTLLVRSDYDVLKTEGARIDFADGAPSIRLREVGLARTPGDVGPADWVLIGLKTTHNAQVIELTRPLLRPDGQTRVLSMQNGLGNIEHLQQHLPPCRVGALICHIGVVRSAPGVWTSFVPGGGSLQAAAPEASPIDWGPLEAGLQRAGLAFSTSGNLDRLLWRKLLWNIPFNGLCVTSGGLLTDAVLADAALRGEALALMHETLKAAQACGVELSPALPEQLMTFTEGMEPYAPSSLEDYRAGRPLEVEALFGEPLRRGLAAGAALPRLQLLYALMRALTRATTG